MTTMMESKDKVLRLISLDVASPRASRLWSCRDWNMGPSPLTWFLKVQAAMFLGTPVLRTIVHAEMLLSHFPQCIYILSSLISSHSSKSA
jgi:hypothetical protein